MDFTKKSMKEQIASLRKHLQYKDTEFVAWTEWSLFIYTKSKNIWWNLEWVKWEDEQVYVLSNLYLKYIFEEWKFKFDVLLKRYNRSSEFVPKLFIWVT